MDNKLFKIKKYFSEGNGGVDFYFAVKENANKETYLNFEVTFERLNQTRCTTEFQMTKRALETLMDMLNDVRVNFPIDSKEKSFICDDTDKVVYTSGENNE